MQVKHGVHTLKEVYPPPESYVFIRIPRTGSTSITHALHKTINHKTGIELRDEDENFYDKWRFSFVRNPHDRFLSAFYFSGEFLRYNLPPNKFLQKHKLEDLVKQANHPLIFLRPMHEYLYDEKGELMVDFVGRFENLNDDWESVKEKLEVEANLPHLRYCRYVKVPLTDASKEILYDFYKKDFELFDYNK